jgi:hypothetical protein
MKPRSELRVEDEEVVDPDATLLAEELEADDLSRRRPVAGREHPLKLLAGNDRDHPVAASALRGLQVRAHVIELAIIPPRAIGLLELKDQDPALNRERLDLAAKPVSDQRKQRRRRDLVPEMISQEPHHLKLRDIRVQVHPIDTLDLERHMTLEHDVDARHAHHQPSITHIRPALPAHRPAPRPGRPGSRPDPLPPMP